MLSRTGLNSHHKDEVRNYLPHFKLRLDLLKIVQMIEEGRKILFTQLSKIRREYTEIYLLEIPSLFLASISPIVMVI